MSWLRTINADPAWAIVQLFERNRKGGAIHQRSRPAAELVDVGRRRALIVVEDALFTTLPSVSLIPLASGRSFLALEAGRGMADLEVAVVDRLEDPDLGAGERAALGELRSKLRAWRTDPGLGFETRSIILAERQSQRRSATASGRR